MITVYAYEDGHGKVMRLLCNDDDDKVYIEQLADEMCWSLIHTYPIENAARFR